MAYYRRAPAAVEDLTGVWSYIARDNPAAADRVLIRIDRACQRLAENPYLGRSREEWLPGVRSRVVHRYVIIYRIAAPTIEVVRVLHGARDIKAVLSNKKP